jgi:hypothetical protein
MKSNYHTLFFGMLSAALLASPLHAADVSLGVATGYKGGLGFAGSATLANFARGFPLAIELTINHVRMEPGSPEKARKIFINDATDGTPEKMGYAWDVQLDFLHRVKMLETRDAFVYVGVRHSMFTANFKFVGGNEFFDIQTDQWGIGAGVKAVFPMASRVGFTVKLGLEHYFASTLYGHDTTYGPDGVTISGRNNYTYADADEAINQPKFNIVGMLGVSFGL